MALQSNGNKLKVKMLIDTGASHAVSLYNYDKEAIVIPEKKFRSYLGRGTEWGNTWGNCKNKEI